MSNQALQNLRVLWQNLVVEEIAQSHHEPKDVISVMVGYDPWRPFTEDPKCVEYQQWRNIGTRPEDASGLPADRVEVHYQSFFGFTKSGTYFHYDQQHWMDFRTPTLELLPALNWPPPGKPEPGDLIVGQVLEQAGGKAFIRWSRCSQQLAQLIRLIRQPRSSLAESENDLAKLLITDEFYTRDTLARQADTYWAIARLVLLDNLKAFADNDLTFSERPEHPCAGQPYGRLHGPVPRTVHHRGMELSGGGGRFVHQLGHVLQEPEWWPRFKQLLEVEQPSWSTSHHDCPACSVDSRRAKASFDAMLRSMKKRYK